MFLSKLMPVNKAQNLINPTLKKVGVEEISLENGYMRVLAEEVTSVLNSPPFERSSMDGYALRAEDTFGFSESNPARFKIIDKIGAGEISNAVITEGKAVKIATGAPIPKGATAVVMEEYTVSDGGTLDVEMTLKPNENISPMGEDIKVGDIVLKAGKVLKPADLAIIASAGFSSVKVYKKPKIGIIITGSELVMPRPDIKGAEVINSNYYTFKAIAESANTIPTIVHCIDSHQRVEDEIEKLLETSDIIVTTGGTAISKGDVVVDVVDKIGEVLVHGVSLRPGKPFGFGIINNTPVFMLSGYPVAAMVQADVFLRNNLLKIQGIDIELPTVRKIASRKIPSSLGRTDYIRAKTDGSMVRPLQINGSGIIRIHGRIKCLHNN